nr:hypothetical protein [uncultured Niameybacter sp.]
MASNLLFGFIGIFNIVILLAFTFLGLYTLILLIKALKLYIKNNSNTPN